MRIKFINFIEKKIISIIVILTLAASCYFRIDLLSITKIDTLLTNSITITSIFIGILMSLLGFLLTVSGKAVVRNLKKLNAHKMLLNYFMLPICSGILTVILSLIMTISSTKNKNISVFLSVTWIILITYFILAFIRVIVLMYCILIEVFEDNESEIDKTESNIQEMSIDSIPDNYDPFDDPRESL